MRGPMIEAMPNMDPMRPTYMGLFSSGTICVRISDEPEKMPAEPMPATARPIMKAVELGAAPQIAEPTSKTTTPTR